MVRSVQLRCRGLTVVVPDMARSAATILCLGAHHILMGPGGDPGPIGPQMLFPGGDGKPAVASPAVASAKEVVAAVAEAEERIKVNPDSFPLFASLLSDATMLMVEQARAALSRSGALMQEASRARGRSEEDVQSIGLRTLTAHRCACQPLCGDLCRSCGRLWASLLLGPTWAASGGD